MPVPKDEVSDFELFIGEQKLTTFTNGWVKRELDTAADSFEFQYADLRLGPGEPVPIRAGDKCSIKLRGNTLLTGYVDDTSFQYTADSLTLTVRGRSKTGDLVDSSAIRESGRWSNATLETIASDLTEPFDDIEVTVDALEGIDEVFKRFAIEPGESCMDAIQRASRLRSAWATCTVEGGLLITRSGTGAESTMTLEYGKNIISGERFDSWSQRHSAYLLKGQVPSDEELNGTASSQLSEFIFDVGLNRYRPLLLVSTGHDRKGDLKRRAQWERNRRAGTGERLLYRVDGYGFASGESKGQFQKDRRDDYKLWEPNMLVKAADPRLETEDIQYLIAAVSYRWQAEGDDGGRTTDLTLTRPEAFSLQEYPKRARRVHTKDIKGWWYSPENARNIGILLARGKRVAPEPEWQGPPPPLYKGR
jgi:prophage tail gpP-like protein